MSGNRFPLSRRLIADALEAAIFEAFAEPPTEEDAPTPDTPEPSPGDLMHIGNHKDFD